jgi:hypothetical protein
MTRGGATFRWAAGVLCLGGSALALALAGGTSGRVLACVLAFFGVLNVGQAGCKT